MTDSRICTKASVLGGGGGCEGSGRMNGPEGGWRNGHMPQAGCFATLVVVSSFCY